MLNQAKQIDKSELHFSIRPLQSGDGERLEPVLRQHIRAQDTGLIVESEVEAVLGYMHGAPDAEGRLRSFLVVTIGSGSALGCAALTVPDALMRKHFSTDAPESMEFVSAFVSSEHFRGKGLGKLLFDQICNLARSQGAKQLLVNSGPRYQASWGFYDKVCDCDNGFIENKYGEGRHAKTWSKALSGASALDLLVR